MKKRSFLLMLIIPLFLTTLITQEVIARNDISGSGTSLDPYRIYTFAGLEMLGNEAEGYSLDAYYQLANDIDASPTGDSNYNNGQGWSAVGPTYEEGFNGVFDGKGYQISNLYIDNNIEATNLYAYKDFEAYQGARVGLFGVIRGEVKNLDIVDAQIKAEQLAGLLAGQVSSTGKVNNFYATGSVEGIDIIGGLAGVNLGEIIESNSRVDIHAEERAGGLVGKNLGLIKDSFAEGNLIGIYLLGGLVGINFIEGEIENSYALGDVAGNPRVVTSSKRPQGRARIGGLVGANSINAKIKDSFAEGDITQVDRDAGGLLGINLGLIESSYAIGDVAGSIRVGGLAGHNRSYAIIKGSYAEGSVNGHNSVGEIIGLNSAIVYGDRDLEELIGTNTRNAKIKLAPQGASENPLDNFRKVAGAGIGVDGHGFEQLWDISLEEAAVYALENPLIQSFNYVEYEQRADFHFQTAEDEKLIDDYIPPADYYELIKAQESNFENIEEFELIEEYESEVINLTNQERENRGLEALEYDSKLSEVARIKSEDMRDNDYYAHNSPNYGSPFEMLRHYNIQYALAAENIHMSPFSAKTTVQDWMISEGHKRNILNPSFSEIGVGFAIDEKGNTYWTQLFIGH